MDYERCDVCGMYNKSRSLVVDDSVYRIYCAFCGEYHMTSKMCKLLEKYGAPHTLSCWIKEQNTLDIVPLLHHDDFKRLTNIPDKSIKRKYELLIDYFNKVTIIFLDEEERVNKVAPYIWCRDGFEYDMLLQKAQKMGHIEVKERPSDDRPHIEITFDGRAFIEDLEYKTQSNKIFMAFHFTDEMKEQFESTVRRAVTDASENRLEAVRVSSSTTDHDTKIDDELIGMLKSSKAVIADFTGQRNAVYYEAGYAMGLGIPVIWTCRDTDADALSFDTRQYPHIIWKDEDDLYKQVVNRLKAKII